MDKILILEFGSQTTQLIARRIRELKVYSEIHPYDWPFDKVRELAPKGIILSGSPARIIDPNTPRVDPKILKMGIPVLGICYGMQEMARTLGGEVAGTPVREYGLALMVIDIDSPLFRATSDKRRATRRMRDEGRGTRDEGRRTRVWMSHNDIVSKLPPGFKISAHTKDCEIAAMEDEPRGFFGTQFHPEVTHTKAGKRIFSNFVFDICKCKPSWTMKMFIEDELKKIREKVGEGHVICGLSGGVDSSVTATLVNRAIGDRLTCIFVDTGLLRKGEAVSIAKTFKNRFKFIKVDAEDRFLNKLAGVTDPEEKRKIIGNEFVRIFEEVIPPPPPFPPEADQPLAEEKGGEGGFFLAQGTTYPDVIESASSKGPASRIKTHHNVGGLPEKMKFKLIEPLRELFKDEVREVGRELGLPDEILMRQPFPGPGLAVRVIGEITRKNLELLRSADEILTEEIKAAGLYKDLWQSFCLLLPVKTVGVMGDERTYENVAAIRAVTSEDAMTADWARLPHELLAKVSNRIINEVRGINRVVYDISSKPPATIEWE